MLVIISSNDIMMMMMMMMMMMNVRAKCCAVPASCRHYPFALTIGLSHSLQAAGHALAMLGSRAAGSIHSISVICIAL